MMKAEEGYFATGAAQIHYQCYGSGFPLLLLHGNGQDKGYFRRHIPRFVAAGYQVIAPDSRGHGRSSFGHQPLRIDVLAGDMVALLDHLGITRAFVVGYSDGGNIGLQLAVHAPEQLAGLVAISPNVRPHGLKKMIYLASTIAYHFCQVLRQIPWFGKQAQYLYLVSQDESIDVAGLYEITTPVLILAGNRDVVRDDHLAKITAAIPRAVLQVIPGAGHRLMQTHQHQVDSTILAFFAQQKRI